jgi:hypothetical protein
MWYLHTNKRTLICFLFWVSWFYFSSWFLLVYSRVRFTPILGVKKGKAHKPARTWYKETRVRFNKILFSLEEQRKPRM